MVLKSFASRTEAEIIKGLLETHGIKASITDKDRGGTQSFLQQSQGVVLEVSARDSSKALDIIKRNNSSTR